MATYLSAPPAPRDPVEAQRVEHTRMRRKILYGLHEELIKERLVKAIGTTRANATRIVDLTTNVGWYCAENLAALYGELPEVSPPEGGEEAAAAVLDAGFWQLAARNQRDTIALNDNFVRVWVDPETREPSFLLVPPDLVEVTASPINPSQPLAIKEWIADPDDSGKWVQLVCDPRSRTYQALDDHGIDVTGRVLGAPSFSGDAYPFVVEGKPVLPYVAYHAKNSGYTLDPYSGREVWEGTLHLCVLYSFWSHGQLQASWAQTIGIGVRPVGGDLDESGRRRDIVADPANMLMFESDTEGGGGNPQVTKIQASFDAAATFQSIQADERRIVEAFLSNAGVSRRDSDVRSAMSLAVSREAKREAQRAYMPSFKRSDLALLRLVAGLRGEATQGWDIRYRAIPRDSAELDSEMARIEKMLANKLIDRVGAYRMINPDIPADQARQNLAEIDGAGTGTGGASAPTIALTSTDIAGIVTVDEARRSQGLPPLGTSEGALTVTEYQARHAAVVAAAANAAAGDPSGGSTGS